VGDFASSSLAWSAAGEFEGAGPQTGDPLGLRVFIRHLGARISPALTRASTKVWGFGLLALGLRVAGGGVGADRRFLRWQRLMVLAAVHQSVDNPPWILGGVEGARTMVRAGTPVHLDRSLLAHERAAGLWGGYARASAMYEIIRSGPRGGGHGLTAHGDDLASATARALGSRSDRLQRLLTADEVDLGKLRLHFTTRHEPQLERLSDALRASDTKLGGRLAGLWQQLEGLDRRSPGDVDLTVLSNADQRDAIEAVRDVADLVEQVETAFRAGIPDGFDQRLATHPGFDHADAAGYDLEYEPVRAALMRGGGACLDALWAVHAGRYPSAGAWDRGQEQVPWSEKVVPDFGLDAVTALYAQGVQL
jgi:hypothetical protein